MNKIILFLLISTCFSTTLQGMKRKPNQRTKRPKKKPHQEAPVKLSLADLEKKLFPGIENLPDEIKYDIYSHMLLNPYNQQTTYTKHHDRLSSISINKNRNYLATTSPDTYAYVIDINSGDTICSDKHNNNVLSGLLDGTTLVTAAMKGTVHVSDIEKKKLLFEIVHGEEITNAIALNRKTNQLLTGSDDNYLRFWDLTTHQNTLSCKHDGTVWHITLSEDNDLVATASLDHKARVFNAITGKLIQEVNHDDIVSFAQITNDNQNLITGSNDNTACIWAIATGNKIATMQHTSRVYGLRLYRKHNLVATGSSDGYAYLWDSTNGKNILTKHCGSKFVYDIDCNDTATLFAASSGNFVFVWNKHGDLLAKIQHSCPCGYLTFGQNTQLFTSDTTGQVYLWEPYTLKQLIFLNFLYSSIHVFAKKFTNAYADFNAQFTLRKIAQWCTIKNRIKLDSDDLLSVWKSLSEYSASYHGNKIEQIIQKTGNMG